MISARLGYLFLPLIVRQQEPASASAFFCRPSVAHREPCRWTWMQGFCGQSKPMVPRQQALQLRVKKSSCVKTTSLLMESASSAAKESES